jgi:hypothetical protein
MMQEKPDTKPTFLKRSGQLANYKNNKKYQKALFCTEEKQN